MYRIMDFLITLGTKILGDNNTAAVGKTHEKADEHIDDRAGGTDSRESLVADIVADDPGIDRVVKLLEDVADQKRECECDQMADDRAFCHIDIAPRADEISDCCHDGCLFLYAEIQCNFIINPNGEKVKGFSDISVRFVTLAKT
jgi:hypothetical protein